MCLYIKKNFLMIVLCIKTPHTTYVHPATLLLSFFLRDDLPKMSLAEMLFKVQGSFTIFNELRLNNSTNKLIAITLEQF